MKILLNRCLFILLIVPFFKVSAQNSDKKKEDTNLFNGKRPISKPPFTYKGVILNPVLGWTNHHSIVEFKGKWYLFYHDSTLSGGRTHLRNVKVTELQYNADGSIKMIDPYID
jgi:hypothetical protein